MCFKVYLSAALLFAFFLTFSEGFFLPVFVRKQAPQTPAVNNAQWAAPPPHNPGTSSVQTAYKDYTHYHQQQPQPQPQPQPHMMSQQSMQLTPLHPVSSAQQYSYDAPVSMALPYQQMQSAFHSVQLVPCLCPISKDVIEQQTQQMQHAAAPPAPTPPHNNVESGSNSVMVQGSHKISS